MRAAMIAALAAIAAVAGMAGAFLIPGFGAAVTVTQFEIQGSGSCGLSLLVSDSGFTLPAGGEEQFSSANIVAPDCVIDSITSNTSGFEVTSANVPYSVGSESAPLRWTVQAPLVYHGSLAIVVHGYQVPRSANTTGSPACGSDAPCTQIPSGLYLFSWGEVLPSGWIVVEGASLGTLISVVAWGIARKR